MNIDNRQVFLDQDDVNVTFAELPDPASLDDETLDLWQLTTLLFEVAPVVNEYPPANERYYAWEAAIQAEWDRRWPDGRSPTVRRAQNARMVP